MSTVSGRVPSRAEVVELTDDQARESFDGVTRREMGVPGEEFLRRYDAGHYEGVDLDSVPGLADVWTVLPLVR